MEVRLRFIFFILEWGGRGFFGGLVLMIKVIGGIKWFGFFCFVGVYLVGMVKFKILERF